METAIQVVWWIGLIGALIPTVVILKQVFLIVGVLRAILRLTEYTRDAARGVASNVAAAEGLAGLGDLLRPVPPALVATAAPVESVARRLHAALGR